MTSTGHDQLLAAEDWAAVAEELCRHDAVAEAIVLPSDAGNTAYVVVDADQAPQLLRACQLFAAGRLNGLAWHEPADDLLLAQVNRSETDFLYQEIFANNAYLRHGLCLTEGAIVVDVGANIGMFTVFAATRCRGVRVVAIEPVAELARAIEVNAALHGIDATVVNCALGSGAGEADFTFYPGNTVMSGLHADDEDREVLRNYLMTGDGAEHNRQLDAMVADRLAPEHRTCRVDTLSAVVARHHLGRIDLLKIDVEKAERDVLAGMDDATWELVDQIVVEVHDLQGRLDEILELLAARGFATTSDQDPRLAHTPRHTVYGHRLPTERRPSDLPPSPRWATRRALEVALRERLGAHEPRLPAPDDIEMVLALPDGAEPGVGAAKNAGAGAVAEECGVDVPSCGGGRGRAVLAEIWETLFGVAAVRDEADFFDLGGDSLTAVRLLVKLEERLGEDIVAPDTVFIASRFADLAAAVEAALAARSPA